VLLHFPMRDECVAKGLLSIAFQNRSGGISHGDEEFVNPRWIDSGGGAACGPGVLAGDAPDNEPFARGTTEKSHKDCPAEGPQPLYGFGVRRSRMHMMTEDYSEMCILPPSAPCVPK